MLRGLLRVSNVTIRKVSRLLWGAGVWIDWSGLCCRLPLIVLERHRRDCYVMRWRPGLTAAGMVTCCSWVLLLGRSLLAAVLLPGLGQSVEKAVSDLGVSDPCLHEAPLWPVWKW